MTISNTQLRAFHAVAAEGSFTRAAERLAVSQPTLSGQVKELETRYGVRLFDRRSREIELTALGRALFDVTRRQFKLEGEAEELLRSAQQVVNGHLRVGADSPYHVVPMLAAFSRRHPKVTLSIILGNSERVRRELIERRTDLAVLPKVHADARFHVHALPPNRLIVFTDRGHDWAARRSIRLAELAKQRVILRERGSTTRAVLDDALQRAGVTLESTLEIGSREGVREAVATGLGVGVVSEGELGHDVRLHPLSLRDAHLETTEAVVCLHERQRERIVTAFFDVLGDEPDTAN